MLIGDRDSESLPCADTHAAPPAHSEHGEGPSAWTEQVRHAVRSLQQLEGALQLTDAERAGVRYAEQHGLPLSITPYYLSLCDRYDERCPIRRQCVPRIDEQQEVVGDLADPLGEVEHEVAPSLIRRYPDRVLLIATDRCGVYCRFCTRSRVVGDGGGPLRQEQLAPALAWLRAHPEVSEVIVSGGDPLVMATDRLVALLAALKSVPSVQNLRLATRCPVTLPQRITPELLSALRAYHPLWIMTHFNHPKELTATATDALHRLADHGFPVMNQSVLLAGVNDAPAVLEALFRGLVARRVRPYYLLQADPVRGTGHLRTSIAEGLAIMEALQGRLSGIALPKFIVDVPGGRGKVPMLPDYVVAREPGKTTLRTFRGEHVAYLDPPRNR